jgi:predicted solute-binding protein
VLHASVEYALKHPDEVFPAVAKATNTEPEFFKAWFSRYSEFPAELTQNDVKAIGLLWKRSIELGILKKAPPVMETVWKPAVQD